MHEACSASRVLFSHIVKVLADLFFVTYRLLLEFSLLPSDPQIPNTHVQLCSINKPGKG